MAALSQNTCRKLSLLQLAEELGNVSKACRLMGYHRDTFCEVRRTFQVGGIAGLVEKKRDPQAPHPNRVEPEVEEKILAYALERPTHGQQRVANELRLQGRNVSPAGVRAVWHRHGLETRHKRLLRLEQEMRDDTFILSEEQIELLERAACVGISTIPLAPAMQSWSTAGTTSSGVPRRSWFPGRECTKRPGCDAREYGHDGSSATHWILTADAVPSGPARW